MRFTLLPLVVIFALSCLLPMTASADGVLAFGVPDGDPENGWVFGHATGNDAPRIAMRYCRGLEKENNDIPPDASKAQKACEVVATYHDKCWAISSNGSHTEAATGLGWSINADPKESARLATEKCRSMAGKRRPGDCGVKYKGCEGAAGSAQQ